MSKELKNTDYSTPLEKTKKSHKRLFWIFTFILVILPLMLTWTEIGRQIINLFGFFNVTIIILFNVWFVSFENNDDMSAKKVIDNLTPQQGSNMGNSNELIKQRNELLKRIAPPKSARLQVAIISGLAVIIGEWILAYLQFNLSTTVFTNISSALTSVIALWGASKTWKEMEDEREIYYFFMRNGVDPAKIYDDMSKKYKNINDNANK